MPLFNGHFPIPKASNPYWIIYMSGSPFGLRNCCDTTSLRKQPTFSDATTGFHAKWLHQASQLTDQPGLPVLEEEVDRMYACTSSRSFENVIAKWTFLRPTVFFGQKLSWDEVAIIKLDMQPLLFSLLLLSFSSLFLFLLFFLRYCDFEASRA